MLRTLKLSTDSVLVRRASNQEYSSYRESSLALKAIESLWQEERGLFRWLEIRKAFYFQSKQGSLCWICISGYQPLSYNFVAIFLMYHIYHLGILNQAGSTVRNSNSFIQAKVT
jgi:hypothetical protein